MYIGYLQFDPQTRNISDNVLYILKKCQRQTESLIVLPELCFNSYYDFQPTTLQTFNNDIAKLITLSKYNKLTLVGTIALSRQEISRNRIFYIQNGKLVIGHAKHKLFAQEKTIFFPGTFPFTIIHYQGITIGTCICLDILNPSFIRQMVQKGIDILLIPSTVSLDYLWTIAKARSLENQIITIFANRSGKEKTCINYLGKSTIFYPDGKHIASTKLNDLKIIEVTNSDLEKMRQMRKYLEII